MCSVSKKKTLYIEAIAGFELTYYSGKNNTFFFTNIRREFPKNIS